MQEQVIFEDPTFDFVLPVEQARITNLCAFITGSRAAAEDLAQEAMIEAWQNRHKLVDPEGFPRWLSVVARNVCLRWMRRQGRAARFELDPADAEPIDLDSLPAGEADLEIELERDELARLLDRAMDQLPPETRSALVQRYILEIPQAEIAARLGLSEGAVEARLQRGKLSLHRLLVTDLQDEAQAYGLWSVPSEAWQETRIWCPICGRRKLHGVLPTRERAFELHCPDCSWEPNAFFAQSSWTPGLQQVSGFKATLRRFTLEMRSYLGAGLESGQVTCRTCGHSLRIQYELPAYATNYPNLGRRGVNVKCPQCGTTSYADLYGLALDMPEAQKYWQQHPKIYTLPEREIEVDGQAALWVRFQSIQEQDALDVIVSKDRYTRLAVHLSQRG